MRAEKEVLEDRLKRALAASGKSKDLNTEEPPVFFISAATGEGMPNLLDATVRLLDALRKKEKVLEPQLGGEPRQLRGLERRNSTSMVVIENGVYVVKSDELERLAEGSDINDYRVMLQLWKRCLGGAFTEAARGWSQYGRYHTHRKVELEWS